MSRALILLVLLSAPAFAGTDYEKDGGDTLHRGPTPAVTMAARPFSIALWAKTESHAVNGSAFGESDTATTNNWFGVTSIAAGANAALVLVGPGAAVATTTNSFTDGTWSHYAAIDTSATNHVMVLDGNWASRGTSSASASPGSMSNTTMGAVERTSVVQQFDGSVAYVTIWEGYALTQGDVEALAAGKHPMSVHPEKITHFWPCYGDGPVGTRLRDLVGDCDLDDAPTGTPTKVDVPPLLHPFGPYYGSRLMDPLRLLPSVRRFHRCREEDYRATAA